MALGGFSIGSLTLSGCAVFSLDVLCSLWMCCVLSGCAVFSLDVLCSLWMCCVLSGCAAVQKCYRVYYI